MLEDRTLLSASMVADLNTTVGFNANPSGFATLNGSAYFFANDGVHGVELWKSSAGGTQLVKDINPGSGSSSLPLSPPPVVFNNTLYFFANDGIHGPQLWKSNGTSTGTVALTGGAPGITTYATQVAAANGLIFFTDPATNQLWETDGIDGTSAHTHAVTDLVGNTLNSPFDLASIGGTLYFSGEQSGGTQAGLWKTDGSQVGTSFVHAFTGSITDLTDVGGTGYFVVTSSNAHGLQDVALWTVGGLALNGSLVKDFGTIPTGALVSVADLTAFNGKLYFTADDHSGAGIELWTSDGTTTQMVTGVSGGSTSSLNLPLQADLTSFNGSLYFLGDDSSGLSLWKSDGTIDNATEVLDGSSNPISMSGTGGILSVVNNTDLYFAGANADGSGLWKTNGTTTDFVPSGSVIAYTVNAAFPGLSTDVSGVLYFSAQVGTHGFQLWTSDGSAANTGMVTDISPDASSNPQTITDVNGIAYFVAGDGAHDTNLYRSDGTQAGTTLVKSGLTFAGSPRLLNVHGTLYFFAYDGNPANGAVQLWKSDGTPGGTTLVKGFNPRQTGPFGYLAGLPDTLTNVNGTVYFVADDDVHGLELWKTDGTPGGTTLVTDLNAGINGSNPGNLTAVGNLLFFTATDGTNTGLFKTDGTTTTFLQAGASNLVNVDGTLAFTGPDSANPQNGPALWKTTDGSTITLVKSLGSGSSPRLLTNVNGALAFLVDSGSNTETLWTSNGTDASTIPLHPFSGNQPLSELTALGNTLYFINNTGTAAELWKSNGTVATTGMVTTLQSAFSPAFFGLTNINGTLTFAASDGSHGQELWASNGSTAGLVQDLNAGVNGSFPHDFTSVGGRLFFAANDGLHGTELFADLGSASKTSTATVLGVSATSLTYGTPVTLTAQVRPPHGNVDGGNVAFVLDGQTVLGIVPVNSAGVAMTTQILGPGPHSVVAIYGGDANFGGSVSAPVGVNVLVSGPTATTTTLVSSASTVVQGQSVTLTTTVKPVGGGNVDGGNVDIMDGTTDLGLVPVDPTTGIAQVNKVLGLGSHNLIAIYPGDTQFGGSVSSSVNVTVTIPSPPGTTTNLTSSATTVVEGNPVTLTATVQPGQGSVDGGTVTFENGTENLGEVPVDPATGKAELTVVLAHKAYLVTANYSGDANYGGSSSSPPVHLTVVAPGDDTTTSLSASPMTAVENQSVTLTATVTPTGGGNVDGGTVDFMDGSTDLGSVGVDSSGVAVLSEAFSTLGSHEITASYSGDATFGASSSSTVDVMVEPATDTQTILHATPTDATVGESVTFTATVTPQGGGNVDAGTEVDFKDGSTDLGMAPVNASGVATLPHSFTTTGTHHIIAHYLGDIQFNTSDSSQVDVIVSSPSQQLSTSTTLTASATSLASGQSVTLTASVIGHSTSGSVSVDGGSVLFQDHGVLVASAPLDVHTGTAVLPTTLGPGQHDIVAVYFGDMSFSPSSSSSVPITVAPPPAPAKGDITSTLVAMSAPTITVVGSGRNRTFVETFTFQNNAQQLLEGQLFVVVRGLRSGITLRGIAGFAGKKKKRSPYVKIDMGNTVVQPNGMITVTLRFNKRPNPVSLSVFADVKPQ
jgi:ELWxxDGT repeat protein